MISSTVDTRAHKSPASTTPFVRTPSPPPPSISRPPPPPPSPSPSRPLRSVGTPCKHDRSLLVFLSFNIQQVSLAYSMSILVFSRVDTLRRDALRRHPGIMGGFASSSLLHSSSCRSCVCAHIHTKIHTFTHTHKLMNIHTYIQTKINTYIYTLTQEYMRINQDKYVLIFVFALWC